jgi:murein DD-endopeptidase MepM/ murein hydrolase activator NlpD
MMLARKTQHCIVLAIAVVAIRWHGAVAESLPTTSLLPPVSATCISSPFGPRVLPNVPEAGSYHYGVDLPAPVGTSVIAAAPGSVIRVQRKGPGGLEMLVQHDGFVGIYSHFGMIAPAFAEGKRTVAAGEKLGVVGRTGVSLGAHLYFEMVLDGRPVDPTPYLGLPRCGGGATTTTARRDTDGVTVGGRKYYQLSLPDRQYSDWQQH